MGRNNNIVGISGGRAVGARTANGVVRWYRVAVIQEDGTSSGGNHFHIVLFDMSVLRSQYVLPCI